MTPGEATRVVLLTPGGRGAVATVLVAGPAAVETVEALFHAASGRPLAGEPVRKVIFGRWQSAESGEEVVGCRQADDRVEIHCHGGDAAAAAIIKSLVARGCQQVDWAEWVAFAEPDPTASAALVALAKAATARTAAILWDQYQGALRRAYQELLDNLTAGNVAAATAKIAALLAWAPLGHHLTEPWKVVLAGPPNVGKSSLINALLGFERVIVHDTPGTTRDVVATLTAIDGWPVELADTAGLHTSSDPLEAAGIERAEKQVAAGDLVVLVADASGAQTADPWPLVGQWPLALRVWSKCDQLTPGKRDLAGGLPTSVQTGAGLEALRAAIARALVPREPPPGQAVPFTAAQAQALEQALRLLAEGRVSEASAVLAQRTPTSP